MQNKKLHSLLFKWHHRIRASQRGHYKAVAILERKQKSLGMIVVVLTSIIGTSLFYSLTNTGTNDINTFITGIISAIATVLAALQTHLNYPAKQTTHIIAATQLSSLKKRIEEKVAVEDDEKELKSFIREIRAEWDAITSGAPVMDEKTFNRHAGVSDEFFQLETVQFVKE